MRLRKPKIDAEKRAQIIAEARGARESRESTYREKALKLFPHVCGRCGREFSGKDLRELTVHHKDNDHMNNPPDGSNWELLCEYCHDNEHKAAEHRDAHGGGVPLDRSNEPALGFSAFAGLKDMIKTDESETDSSEKEGK